MLTDISAVMSRGRSTTSEVKAKETYLVTERDLADISAVMSCGRRSTSEVKPALHKMSGEDCRPGWRGPHQMSWVV